MVLSNKLKFSIDERIIPLENIIQLHFDELNALAIIYGKDSIVDRMGVKYTTYQRLWVIRERIVTEKLLSALSIDK